MFSLYVVSIEERESQRLNSFFKQNFFKDIPERDIHIEGVKGGEITAKEYFNLAVNGRVKPLTPGELGCTLSHLEIYKKFLQTGDDFALIFEDDAIFPSTLTSYELLNQIKKIELEDCFLLSLGGVQMKVCRNVRGEFQKSKILSKTIIKINPHFYNRVCYTFAYVIDRKMAEVLLAYHRKLRRADDWSYLYDFNPKAKIYMTNLIDHPVEQNIDNSYIESERVKSSDILRSHYGYGISKQIAKIKFKKFEFF